MRTQWVYAEQFTATPIEEVAPMFINVFTTGTAISQALAANPASLLELVAQGENIDPHEVHFHPSQGRGSGRVTTPETTYVVRCRAIGLHESESLSVQVRTVKLQPPHINTQYQSIIFIWRHKEGNAVSAVAFPGFMFQKLLNDSTFSLSEKSGKYHFNVAPGWENQCDKAGIPYITTYTTTSF